MLHCQYLVGCPMSMAILAITNSAFSILSVKYSSSKLTLFFLCSFWCILRSFFELKFFPHSWHLFTSKWHSKYEMIFTTCALLWWLSSPLSVKKRFLHICSNTPTRCVKPFIPNTGSLIGVERNQKQRTGIVSRTSWFTSGYHCLNIVQLVPLCYHFLSQRVFYMTNETCFPFQNIPHYLKYTFRK